MVRSSETAVLRSSLNKTEHSVKHDSPFAQSALLLIGPSLNLSKQIRARRSLHSFVNSSCVGRNALQSTWTLADLRCRRRTHATHRSTPVSLEPRTFSRAWRRISSARSGLVPATRFAAETRVQVGSSTSGLKSQDLTARKSRDVSARVLADCATLPPSTHRSPGSGSVTCRAARASRCQCIRVEVCVMDGIRNANVYHGIKDP